LETSLQINQWQVPTLTTKAWSEFLDVATLSLCTTVHLEFIQPHERSATAPCCFS